LFNTVNQICVLIYHQMILSDHYKHTLDYYLIRKLSSMNSYYTKLSFKQKMGAIS